MAIDSLAGDFKYALRSYAKTPMFSAAVVSTLALGIGASTAIFSMVNGILLQPLPLRDPNRLIYVNEINPVGNRMSVSWPTFLDWVQRARSVESLADTREESFTLTGTERPERVRGRRITAGFLGVVGGRPSLGRDLAADADKPGAAGEVVISDGFWRTRLGADRGVVGRTLRLDDVAYSVVGVLPPSFQFMRSYDVFASTGPISGSAMLVERGNHSGFYAVGRLKEGMTVEAADREFKTIAASLEREYPRTNAGVSARAERLADRLVSDVRPTLLALFGAVGFLLLIACVNAANLLLGRGAARQHELAVRAALGGGPGRLIGQLLMESTVISTAGAALGVAVAFWLLRALIIVAPQELPRLDAVRLDGAALAFALGAAMFSGVGFGLFPALQASRIDAQQTLIRMRSGGASASTHRLRRTLIVIETALAVVLLAGAGLTARTLHELTRVDTGFSTDRLLTMRVMLAGGQWSEARRRTFFTEVAARSRAVPGVVGAALAYSLPIDGSQWNSVFVAADKPAPVRAETPSAAFSPVSATYFETLGMRVVRGRVFDEGDAAGSPLVVVINESLARRVWPGEDPVGKRLKQGWSDSKTAWREVVGVVGDVKFEGLTAETPMQVYVPLLQEPIRSVAAIVRTAASPSIVAAALQDVVRSLDANLPVYSVQTMAEILDTSIARQRMAMVVFIVFAGVALVLASIGVYGVVAQAATERTHEIGVRIALGAGGRHVIALVARQGLSMALFGALLGIAAALPLSRLIQSLLFRVAPTDPATFAIVIVALIVVAAIACALPAWRATRIDPSQALRAE